ncbi:MAG: hypothetical protein H6700_07235 [Myxococcales bacterium]|nr:hypothetical protein [Myxococcales bacterium]MCB9531542.1 hypothetical protein [Myxococcales bacterium]
MTKPPSTTPDVARRRTVRQQRPAGRAPRLLHGTQVAFNIVCDACGAHDTLPFVPKNAAQTLCSNCAKERFGDGWDRGRYEKPREYEVRCASCGAVDFVPFEPDDPGAMLCRRCLRGEEAPTHGRTDGVTVDRRAGVKRRRPE